jgi:hypothetical protein
MQDFSFLVVLLVWINIVGQVLGWNHGNMWIDTIFDIK